MQQKIMFFTPSLNVGGLERISLTYAKALSRKYSVTYVICHDNGTFTMEIDNNINLINLHTGRLRHSVCQLAKVIIDVNPSYIVTVNDATMVVVLSKWIARHSVKIITFQHSYITDEESKTLRSRFIIKLFFRFCYRVIAVSQGIKEMLINTLKVDSKKVILILNPIDVSRILKLSEESIVVPDKYIVFVGRLSPVKNLSFLLKAYALYLQLENHLSLVIVGDGVERTKLLALSYSLGISDKVLFLGERSNPYPIIKKSAVVVLPSYSEALPTVLIEALVLGKTIVATPTKGAKEILDNNRLGYVIDSFDDNIELAKMIAFAYHNPIPQEMLSDAVSKYEIDAKVREFERLL